LLLIWTILSRFVVSLKLTDTFCSKHADAEKIPTRWISNRRKQLSDAHFTRRQYYAVSRFLAKSQ